MARSLNKKYFGNRNVGTTGTADDGIGGEGVGSVTITTEGTYTSALPTMTFSTPDLPGGVRATGTVHGHALTAVATAAGTGYHLGDVLAQNVTSGNDGIYATWNVTGLTVVGITLNNGGTANDVGDEFTFAASGFATPIRVRVTAAAGGIASAVSIVNGGVWTTGALPANSIGMTKTQVAAGQDYNGQGLQVNFTAWGVATVAVAQQGDYTAITSAAKATTATPSGGTGATVTITYGVSGVSINEKGSGYTSPADAAVTFSSGTAAGAAVLTTDSGVLSGTNNTEGQNASDNQENAIIIYANTTGAGSKIGDIVRQVGARRFKVKTADGTAICQLKGSAVSAQGEMTITATDSAGGTYFVTKIGGRKATLTRGTGTQFANDSAVQWTFGSATLNTTVKIANA
jgi:hypothetical protein